MCKQGFQQSASAMVEIPTQALPVVCAQIDSQGFSMVIDVLVPGFEDFERSKARPRSHRESHEHRKLRRTILYVEVGSNPWHILHTQNLLRGQGLKGRCFSLYSFQDVLRPW